MFEGEVYTQGLYVSTDSPNSENTIPGWPKSKGHNKLRRKKNRRESAETLQKLSEYVLNKTALVEVRVG